MQYKYKNINNPNLGTWDELGELVSGIKYDILNSDMTEKNILVCMWEEKDLTVILEFSTELSDSDNNILNNIMEDYVN